MRVRVLVSAHRRTPPHARSRPPPEAGVRAASAALLKQALQEHGQPDLAQHQRAPLASPARSRSLPEVGTRTASTALFILNWQSHYPGKSATLATWPPWPNGQGVGLLIRRLRVRVPQEVLSVADTWMYVMHRNDRQQLLAFQAGSCRWHTLLFHFVSHIQASLA